MGQLDRVFFRVSRRLFPRGARSTRERAIRDATRTSLLPEPIDARRPFRRRCVAASNARSFTPKCSRRCSLCGCTPTRRRVLHSGRMTHAANSRHDSFSLVPARPASSIRISDGSAACVEANRTPGMQCARIDRERSVVNRWKKTKRY